LILPADAISDPEAMMIELFNTFIACIAMSGLWKLYYFTVRAE